MNKEVATVLKNRISDLPFIDVLAGLVQTVESEDFIDGTGSQKKLKRFPVSYDTQGADNCIGREKDLQPNSSRKSIIYFEDYGSQVTGTKMGSSSFNSTLRLVAWMNRKRLVNDSYAEISGSCIAMIIAKLVPINPINVGIFSRLTVKVNSVPAQDAGLFSRYTYDEKVRQYLRPPFEVFGINIMCSYTVNKGCIPNIDFTNENNC